MPDYSKCPLGEKHHVVKDWEDGSYRCCDANCSMFTSRNPLWNAIHDRLAEERETCIVDCKKEREQWYIGDDGTCAIDSCVARIRARGK